MKLPAFFDEVEPIVLIDPLARLLGSAEAGHLSFDYADAVKLAGHSCAAVAGAWLMVRAGLSWLYGDELPVRGAISVSMREAQDQGTTGVVAAVAGLLTGAAAEGGFAGIGPAGLHARRGLLTFDAAIDGVMGLRRLDTGEGVMLDINTQHVAPDPALRELLPAVLATQSLDGPPLDEAPTAEPARRFAALWQDRVRRMLLEHADDPKLVHLYDWI